MHDDFAVYTIAGLISNEYGMTEIEISSGDNYFNLKEGTYQIEFVMDGSYVPWEKTVLSIQMKSSMLFMNHHRLF